VFRKDLSSNRKYRAKNSKKSETNNIYSTVEWTSSVMKFNNNMMKDIRKKMDTYYLPLSGSHTEDVSDTPSLSHDRTAEFRVDLVYVLRHRDIALVILQYLKRCDLPALLNISAIVVGTLNTDFFWEQLWKANFGPFWQHPFVSAIRKRRQIRWDPFVNWGPPAQGWKLFYLEFEYGMLCIFPQYAYSV
jgi:hypothetical protein